MKRIDEVMEFWRIMTEVRELEPTDISIGPTLLMGCWVVSVVPIRHLGFGPSAVLLGRRF